MSETRKLKVQFSNGTIQECSVEYTSTPPWRLKFFGLGLKQAEFEDRDLFEALITLRRELEQSNAQLLCSGARPDVLPSGMSRSMSGGIKAYIIQIGKPELSNVLVNIFDYAEPDIVGTVEEQMAFKQQYINSLKK